jgi:uncharacterized protein (TIGR00269 family)
MKCIKCSEKAVLSSPALCKSHFIEYFEKKVFDTIKKYNLINPADKVCVAASGGKDSTAILYLAKKFLNPKPNQLKALLIDEGIRGYRDRTIKDLKLFCEANKISLDIVSFKKEFGKTLDQIIESRKIAQKPCTICGTLRRYLLNKHSKGFDVIVTGHNLDDEAQAVTMNLFRCQLEILARLGPATGITQRKHFTQRVKPLYFCSEKESALYAILMDFGVTFNECPYTNESYRGDVRNLLNSYESAHKGTKLNIVESFLKQLPKLKKGFMHASPVYCGVCGEPSSDRVCNTCKFAEVISDIK